MLFGSSTVTGAIGSDALASRTTLRRASSAWRPYRVATTRDVTDAPPVRRCCRSVSRNRYIVVIAGIIEVVGLDIAIEFAHRIFPWPYEEHESAAPVPQQGLQGGFGIPEMLVLRAFNLLAVQNPQELVETYGRDVEIVIDLLDQVAYYWIISHLSS